MANVSARPTSGGVPAILEYYLLGYRRYWISTIVVSTLTPLLYLLSLGLGLGSLVDKGNGAASIGVSYIAFLAPALLAAAALQIGAGEASFPVLGNFKWQRVFFGMHGAPLTPRQISTAVLAWIAIRVTIGSVIYIVIMSFFGAIKSPWALMTIPIATFGALAFCSPVVAYSAFTKGESGGFNALFRFVVTPMFLFSGTFYDISGLPAWAQVIAQISPLWHITELCRAVSLGPLELANGLGSMSTGAAIGHLVYLSAWLVVGVLLTQWRFKVRLQG